MVSTTSSSSLTNGFGGGFNFGVGGIEAPVNSSGLHIVRQPDVNILTKAQLCRAGFKYLGIRDQVECVWCGIQVHKFQMLNDMNMNMVCPYFENDNAIINLKKKTFQKDFKLFS